MQQVTINLWADWIATVREVFQGSGYTIPEHYSDDDVSVLYFRQTHEDDAAQEQHVTNRARLEHLQETILANLDGVIVPDIQLRTGYMGDCFEFKWVYQQGEHIVEQQSKYRIPL